MPSLIVFAFGPEVIFQNFPTNERFKRERAEHVHPQLWTQQVNLTTRVAAPDTRAPGKERPYGRTHALAILIRVSSAAKLLRMLPAVLLVKTRNPDVDIARQAMTERAVETWVTCANRSSVGTRSEP
jgi:hypothetical protein